MAASDREGAALGPLSTGRGWTTVIGAGALAPSCPSLARDMRREVQIPRVRDAIEIVRFRKLTDRAERAEQSGGSIARNGMKRRHLLRELLGNAPHRDQYPHIRAFRPAPARGGRRSACARGSLFQ